MDSHSSAGRGGFPLVVQEEWSRNWLDLHKTVAPLLIFFETLKICSAVPAAPAHGFKGQKLCREIPRQSFKSS
jgi:hypothetical protein